ncbi:MAG: hypothetical protein RL095_571 [Verrucomicrobiota bacterium]|jgi:hypothetical protein
MRPIRLAPVLFLLPLSAWAGMPTFYVSDMAKTRLESISFGLVVFIVGTELFRRLWNSQVVPMFGDKFRLGWKAGFLFTGLLSALMLLILTLISGTREVMTPAAWEKDGMTHKIKTELNPRSRIEGLRDDLLRLGVANGGKLPDNELKLPRPELLRAGPENRAFTYLPGQSLGDKNSLLVLEGMRHGQTRLLLFANGDIVESGELLRKILEDRGAKSGSDAASLSPIVDAAKLSPAALP